MGKIYICGGCGVGKAKIAQAVAAEVPQAVAKIDISQQVFGDVFTQPLDHVLARRRWFGKGEQAYQGLMEYLDALSEPPEDEDSLLIYNEGPSMLLSHLIYFGPLYDVPSAKRVEVINRALELLNVGLHVFIPGWKRDHLNMASVAMQEALLRGGDNVILLPRTTGYNQTVEQGIQTILKRIKGE